MKYAEGSIQEHHLNWMLMMMMMMQKRQFSRSRSKARRLNPMTNKKDRQNMNANARNGFKNCLKFWKISIFFKNSRSFSFLKSDPLEHKRQVFLENN